MVPKSWMGLFPVFLVTLTFLTFIVSYTISVARHDVAAVFPYISDTGSERPESCIFGQFLNIAAWLALCTMYFHYKAVKAIVGDINEDPNLRRLNSWALGVGVFSCIGCSMVANFQEGTMVEYVHFTGAALTFVMGVVYCFLQAALSYQMYPCFLNLSACRVRLAISVTALTTTFITVIASIVSFHKWNMEKHDIREKLKWEAGQPGYEAHVMSAVGEWVTALVFFTFFLTFVGELNKFHLEVKLKPAFSVQTGAYEVIGDDSNERSRLIL